MAFDEFTCSDICEDEAKTVVTPIPEADCIPVCGSSGGGGNVNDILPGNDTTVTSDGSGNYTVGLTNEAHDAIERVGQYEDRILNVYKTTSNIFVAWTGTPEGGDLAITFYGGRVKFLNTRIMSEDGGNLVSGVKKDWVDGKQIVLNASNMQQLAITTTTDMSEIIAQDEWYHMGEMVIYNGKPAVTFNGNAEPLIYDPDAIDIPTKISELEQKNDEQDTKLTDHEARITTLESEVVTLREASRVAYSILLQAHGVINMILDSVQDFITTERVTGFFFNDSSNWYGPSRLIVSVTGVKVNPTAVINEVGMIACRLSGTSTWLDLPVTDVLTYGNENGFTSWYKSSRSSANPQLGCTTEKWGWFVYINNTDTIAGAYNVVRSFMRYTDAEGEHIIYGDVIKQSNDTLAVVYINEIDPVSQKGQATPPIKNTSVFAEPAMMSAMLATAKDEEIESVTLTGTD